MNLDDPKLTALALGELPPEERTALEAELAAHPEFLAEVEETREMAGILRTGLKGELAGALAPHQRDVIFRAARVAHRELESLSPSKRPAPLVIPNAKWWDRPGPWQAVAACAMIGFGMYALNVNSSKPELTRQVANAGEYSVPVPTDGAIASNSAGEPNLLSPRPSDPSRVVGSTPIDPSRTLANAPDIKQTHPEVQIDPNRALAGLPPIAQGAPDNAVEPGAKQRGPKVKGTGDQELSNNLAGADRARSENRPGPVTDAEISNALKSLGKEAGRMQAGSGYADFTQVFRPMFSNPVRYEMIRCPSIKVDVEFSTSDGETLTVPPTADSKIKKISKPYIETE